MATTTSLTRAAERSTILKVIDLVPGLLLLAAVGVAGKWIEQSISRYGKAHHMALPNIEYVLWAIGIGLVIANTVGVPKIFQPGLATYEFWLKIGRAHV